MGRITQQDGFIEAISRKVPKDLRTTLTSGQHKDHIATEQRVSRHSMPELLYFLFFPPHIFIQFPRHTASTFANRTKPTHHPKFAKEPFPYP
ncbi:MAG: hypothetical protein IPH58_05085 [Sphingobacteriales bacterium]|nr:hypothetical protein [Sphingobacteriales bacterium]